MSTLKTGALRGTSGSADSIQLHASDQSVTFPGEVNISTKKLVCPGTVIQVVSTTTGSGATITASGVQDTGLSLAITPATGNKVLVQISTHVGMDQPTASNNTTMFSHLYIYRGSGGSGTELMASRIGGTWGGDSSTSGCDNFYASYPLSVLDASPGGDGSTAITYSIYTARDGSNPPTSMIFNNSGETTITLMEIAA